MVKYTTCAVLSSWSDAWVVHLQMSCFLDNILRANFIFFLFNIQVSFLFNECPFQICISPHQIINRPNCVCIFILVARRLCHQRPTNAMFRNLKQSNPLPRHHQHQPINRAKFSPKYCWKGCKTKPIFLDENQCKVAFLLLVNRRVIISTSSK